MNWRAAAAAAACRWSRGDRLSSSARGGGAGSKAAERAAARLRAHVISDKQSTFLMGLFSDKVGPPPGSGRDPETWCGRDPETGIGRDTEI